ncbi:hypothetical protein FH161_00310 [Staphylococcus lugdunensis]|uniref:hypothetical protein n=1 Tax=Staphylococcus lugdunensis TaxID=28035 RepID=UPI001F56F82A|nr:hypothetical protein [Staphylococcus lugdunensis]MCI2750607.1 hypothetical protein [Staphylococcus lugdunensis]MCI2753662.1 hypothetical protein [Staphylococcus lugdunensis]MCI2756614.1 hypothetical protein [Staphylococcus lugdunensis]MCI2782177.1 hypothetical protein [Staphylococcus lugdunensis]MCI2797543.1 hypothetical protein [Staphylococcus lugdunensis]
MFEIERMNETFDYSLVDNETAEFLKEREYTINGIAEDARIKIGRELNKAQEKLANHHEGIFVKWYESGGLDKNQVYYYINLNKFSTNLENTQKDNFLNAPKSLQKEVMKKNAPEELKQKVLDGDITTRKEYKQLQKDKEELEQQNAQLQSQVEQAQRSESIARKQLEDEQNREPEVKREVKEVVPPHVKAQLSDRQQMIDAKDKEIQQLQERLTKAEEQKQKFEKQDYLEEDEQIASISFQVESTVLEIKDNINRFLNENASTAFREAAIARASEKTKNQIYDGVEELEAFCRTMRQSLNSNVIVGG